jgi:hypothetical protein
MSRLESEFKTFHAEHPGVYKDFCRLALEAANRGFARVSSDFLLHQIRWDSDRRLKLNNNFSAYYARLFIREHPRHAYLFELRVTRAERAEPVDVQMDLFGGMA